MKLLIPSPRGLGSFLEMVVKNDSEVCCGISGSPGEFRERQLGGDTLIQTFHLQHDTQINPSAQAVSRSLSCMFTDYAFFFCPEEI